MTAGTPFTVTDGDLLAISFHLTVSSGTANVKIRGNAASLGSLFPAATLITAGPTYTALTQVINLLLIFDDGTLGWLEPSKVCSVVDVNATAPGNGNCLANIVAVPFPVKLMHLRRVSF